MSDTDSDIDTLVDDVHYAVNKETPRGDFGVKIEIFGHDGQNEHRAKHHRSGDGERAGRLAVSPRSSRVCFGEISKQPLTIPEYLAPASVSFTDRVVRVSRRVPITASNEETMCITAGGTHMHLPPGRGEALCFRDLHEHFHRLPSVHARRNHPVHRFSGILVKQIARKNCRMQIASGTVRN